MHIVRWGPAPLPVLWPNGLGACSPPKGGTAPMYCSQTAVRIKMPLGTGIGLGPGHIVLHGDPTPPKKGHSSPRIFGPCLLWPTAGWIKVPLGTEVGLGPCDIVSSSPLKRAQPQHPHFSAHVYCGHGRPSPLLLSSCCSAHGKCRRAHWRHLKNTIEHASLGPPKRQIDRFSGFCTAHDRKSLYLQCASLSPKIAPSHWRIWTPYDS